MNSHGVVTSGEYIEILQATHYLKARLAENVFRLLALKEKVPYTDSGIALVVSKADEVLGGNVEDLDTGEGIIARDDAGNPMYTIKVPKREEIPANTRAQRILPDIEWTAVVAGAIEKVKIRGTLTI